MILTDLITPTLYSASIALYIYNTRYRTGKMDVDLSTGVSWLGLVLTVDKLSQTIIPKHWCGLYTA